MTEIKTKYGAEVDENAMVDYFQMLLGSFYKLLVMHIEDKKYDHSTNAWETLDAYLYSLLCEIAGGNKLLLDDKYFIQLLANLENIKDMKYDYKRYRSHVFKCTNICQKIIENLKEGDS